jgi:hypothetical protein
MCRLVARETYEQLYSYQAEILVSYDLRSSTCTYNLGVQPVALRADVMVVKDGFHGRVASRKIRIASEDLRVIG